MLQNYLPRYIIDYLPFVFILLLTTAPCAFSDDNIESAVDADLWDFGFLPQKAEVSHTFYLRNDNASPLTVREIKAGCSCTSISEIDKPIEPGDSAAVIVTFKSGRYRGPVSKTTRVFIDNPQNDVFEFTIKADVIKADEPSGEIEILPNALEWAFENNPAPNDSIINIANSGMDTVVISMLYLPTDVIKVAEVTPFLPPQGSIDIIIKAAPETALTGIKGLSMTFGFTGKDTTIITVPIKIKNK